MTELLITLMNAPRTVQRAVALGFLGAAVLTVTLVVGSLASILSGKADAISDMRTELYRLDQIIARKPSESQLSSAQNETGTLFLAGGTLPVIQAGLQERVNAVANGAGVTIASISGASPLLLDGATYVGVRADMEGSLRSFHDMIRHLETSEPPLLIRQASIRSTNAIVQGKLSEPPQLSGQIIIYGAVAPTTVLSGNGQP